MEEQDRYARSGDRQEQESEAPPPRPPPRSLDDRAQSTLRWSTCQITLHEAIVHSTMLEVKVNRDEPLELHEQVAAQIRRAIADGEAAPGDRLPPAKDLAAVAGVNKNTVLRALRLLRDEGVLEFRRGRGVTVAGRPERVAIIERAHELVDLARSNGYGRDELIEIIRDVS